MYLTTNIAKFAEYLGFLYVWNAKCCDQANIGQNSAAYELFF